ncbi:hypothetical protein C8J57DRAFT_1608159 [Mycena rebaudengoi]|nr:hypothetical protein C8J57DRAFT_1608159 [Mycena rebaudengoi]
MSAPRSLRSSISEVVPHTPVAPAALQTLFMHVAHASRQAIRSVYLEELCKFGKSSLLMSMLEETTLVTGTVKVKAHKIALASQTPFIYPGTLRANIPLDSAYDEIFYNRVIHACIRTSRRCRAGTYQAR